MKPDSKPQGAQTKRRCLLVERHEWETGFAKEQLQIPLRIADRFFGSGRATKLIRVRIPGHRSDFKCSISKVYAASGTRRLNGLALVGLLGSCFVFIQETDEVGTYDLWCEYDKALVAAYHRGWSQAKDSQYGRGRLALIVNAPVSNPTPHL